MSDQTHEPLPDPYINTGQFEHERLTHDLRAEIKRLQARVKELEAEVKKLNTENVGTILEIDEHGKVEGGAG